MVEGESPGRNDPRTRHAATVITAVIARVVNRELPLVISQEGCVRGPGLARVLARASKQRCSLLLQTCLEYLCKGIVLSKWTTSFQLRETVIWERERDRERKNWTINEKCFFFFFFFFSLRRRGTRMISSTSKLVAQRIIGYFFGFVPFLRSPFLYSKEVFDARRDS